MNSKKDNLIVFGATGNMTFALANVLIGIKKHSPNIESDIIVFNKDITDKDKQLLNSIVECEFIDYDFPFENTEQLEKSSFNRYSALTFSRFECFRLLDNYRKVLWLDIDIVIQKDLSEIFKYGESGISLFEENLPLQESFSKVISGYKMSTNQCNAGVLLISDKLTNYHKMTDWLYKNTLKFGECLKYADQGIINLLIQEFNLNVDHLPEVFNCHPTKKSCKGSTIVHSYSPQKFWSWHDKSYYSKEWENNNKKWLKMGGDPYNGLTYDFWEKVVKNYDFNCPHPIRQPRKFIKYLVKKLW